MFIIVFRARDVANSPCQPAAPLIVYGDRTAAGEAASALAKTNVRTDYFVMEAVEKHSASIFVNVGRP